MKFRPVPAIFSLLITLVILFSGWWLFQWVQVKQPISELLNEQPHVNDYTIDVLPSRINIHLQVNSEFTLSSDYLRLLQQIKEESKQTKVTLTLIDDRNDALQATWNDLYFILAEGINRGEYYEMLQQLQQYPLADEIDLQVTMDEERVYVWLEQTKEQKSLFEALPLHHRDDGTEVKTSA